MNVPDISALWTQDHVVSARSFFNSEAGKLLVEIHMARKPRIDNNASDSVVARSGLVRQTWEDCVNGLTSFVIDVDKGGGAEGFKQFDMSDKGFTSKPETK